MITLGLDEVGRGCLAGPLVVGAVILDDQVTIDGLKDSKQLTKTARTKLSKLIKQQALDSSLGWVNSSEIDDLGLTAATSLAMTRAIEQLKTGYDQLIIDGQVNFLKDLAKVKTLVKADQLIPAVSAASIIAKTARDQYMTDLAKDYPDYGFDQHVGYGTALHLAKLKQHGACQLHRRSFKPIKALLFSLN